MTLLNVNLTAIKFYNNSDVIKRYKTFLLNVILTENLLVIERYH